MMRTLAAVLASIILTGAAVGTPAPAPELKAHEFIERCNKDWEFCRVRIQAQMAQLNASREACIPNDEPLNRAALRVAYVLEEVVEEDASLFETGDYSIFTAQIIVFIWPCDVVS